MIDALTRWIAAHPVVDLLLEVAFGGLAVVTTVACACCVVYLALFLPRLLGRTNRNRFIGQPIPHITGGELFGARVGLAAAREISAAEQGTVETLKRMNDRVAALEDALERAERQIAGLENATDRSLLRPGGGHA